ncbi:MAG: serine hydrolase [Candidatus Limnocylindria bacterium]
MPTRTEPQTLADVVESTMREHPVPGVAVGLIADREETMAGFGVTNVDHPLAVDPDTLFQIGSITKTVTATALMRLVDEGRVSLDIPVRTYVPDLRLRDEHAVANVTLRHLLTHTGGWFGDLFADTGMGDDALAKYVARLADIEQLTPLGSVWSYSNSGFALAGRVLEVATGQTAEDALADLVLRPLGMTHSFFFARDAITHRVAAGHFVYEEGPRVARPWYIPRSAHSVGGIVASVRDMLAYARFHLGDGTGPDGTRLLSREAMHEMRAAHAGRDLDARSGLGWRLSEAGGVAFVGHGGGTIGQLALFALAPDRGFALVVLTNSGRGNFVHEAVSRWAYRTKLGIEEPRPAPQERTAEDLAAYAGTYESPGNTYELTLAAGRLVMQANPKVALAERFERRPPTPPPAQVAFCGTDRILVLDGPTTNTQGEFLRDQAGAVEWLRIGGRIHRRRR